MPRPAWAAGRRSEEHTSELQSPCNLVCRLLLDPLHPASVPLSLHDALPIFFVTTATRYADRVPWLVLGRVRERGLPLMVVVNRLPPEAGDRREVLNDVARLYAEAGLGGGPEIGRAHV